MYKRPKGSRHNHTAKGANKPGSAGRPFTSSLCVAPFARGRKVNLWQPAKIGFKTREEMAEGKQGMFKGQVIPQHLYNYPKEDIFSLKTKNLSGGTWPPFLSSGSTPRLGVLFTSDSVSNGRHFFFLWQSLESEF